MSAPPQDHRRDRSRSSSAASRRSRSSETMGLDGGEAGRRAAAEDEYIRRELHQDTSNFCNAFWGSGDAGYEAIQHRMKTGNRTMDDVRALYKERADIEADYAKRLAKLSKTALGKDETGATRHALDVVRAELDMTSRVHADLAGMVRKDLEGSLADFQSKVNAARKQSSAAIEKLFKNKQAQENYVNKSRERYEQDCIKINGYTAQSSLVQGRDLDKVTSKLDKAQSTVAANEKDYQNFVRALKDTTLRWNSEFKQYLDQCQDVEEERLDFIKSNLWNYANAISAVCVADDEGCERVRVALESCDTPSDVMVFIQQRGTGPAIPDPPEYINYSKGQPPPARPAYHTANFQRNSTRVVQPVPPSQPFVPGASAGRTVGGGGPPPGAGNGNSGDDGMGGGGGGAAGMPVSLPSVSGDGFGGGPSMLRGTEDEGQPPPPPAAFKPPPGSIGLPGMAAAAGPSKSADNVPSPVKAERRMSTKNFLARTPSIANRDSVGSMASPSNSAAKPSTSEPQIPTSTSGSEEEDPIAKALANLRMRPNTKSPNPATSPLPPTAGPGGAAHSQAQGRPSSRQQQRPASINAGSDRPTSPAPGAAFMQAPPRAASPLPVEEVLGSYGQSFPGERRSISRQNSMTSARSQQAPLSPSKSSASNVPGRSKSPVPGVDGFAGVGARGRSPSPQPFGRPASRQQHHGQQQQHKPSNASTATARPHHHHGHSQAQGPPQRSTTPLGISLDASGSVTHDQMAQEFMQRAGSVPPPQQHATPVPQQQGYAQPPPQQHQGYGQQPPASPYYQPHQGQPTPQQQQQQPQHQQRTSSYHGGGQPGGYGTPSVPATSSQFTITPNHYAPSPAPSHAQAPSTQSGYYAHQPQQQARPHQPPQQQPQQAYGAAPPFNHQDSSGSLSQASGYGYAQHQQPQHQQQQQQQQQYGHHQPSASQSFPTMQQGAQQYGAQPPHQQQQHQAYAQHQAQPSYHAQQQGHAPAPAQAESPAAAYMHQYQRQSMMQQQQPQPQPQQAQQQQPQYANQGARPASTVSTQSQQQIARPPSTSSTPAPTGQYSDLSHRPILFYVKALFDYQAQSDEEFSFTQGDIIAVTQTDADGWWQGELLDEERREPGRNLMPSNFVTLLEG